MEQNQIKIAKDCLSAAENDTLNFPQIVGNLIAAGFESYSIDFRLGKAFYFLPNGAAVTLDTHKVSAEIGKDFDVEAIKAAIKEAQQQVEGYTYKGFCKKTMQAGCVGYIVSFVGKRAVYFGRTGEIHIEHFPK